MKKITSIILLTSLLSADNLSDARNGLSIFDTLLNLLKKGNLYIGQTTLFEGETTAYISNGQNSKTIGKTDKKETNMALEVGAQYPIKFDNQWFISPYLSYRNDFNKEQYGIGNAGLKAGYTYNNISFYALGEFSVQWIKKDKRMVQGVTFDNPSGGGFGLGIWVSNFMIEWGLNNYEMSAKIPNTSAHITGKHEQKRLSIFFGKKF